MWDASQYCSLRRILIYFTVRKCPAWRCLYRGYLLCVYISAMNCALCRDVSWHICETIIYQVKAVDQDNFSPVLTPSGGSKMEKCISPQGGGWGQKIFGCELWLGVGSTFTKTILGSAISSGPLLNDWAGDAVLRNKFILCPECLFNALYICTLVPYTWY